MDIWFSFTAWHPLYCGFPLPSNSQQRKTSMWKYRQRGIQHRHGARGHSVCVYVNDKAVCGSGEPSLHTDKSYLKLEVWVWGYFGRCAFVAICSDGGYGHCSLLSHVHTCTEALSNSLKSTHAHTHIHINERISLTHNANVPSFDHVPTSNSEL